jgi:hypothetical protein
LNEKINEEYMKQHGDGDIEEWKICMLQHKTIRQHKAYIRQM